MEANGAAGGSGRSGWSGCRGAAVLGGVVLWVVLWWKGDEWKQEEGRTRRRYAPNTKHEDLSKKRCLEGGAKATTELCPEQPPRGRDPRQHLLFTLLYPQDTCPVLHLPVLTTRKVRRIVMVYRCVPLCGDLRARLA